MGDSAISFRLLLRRFRASDGTDWTDVSGCANRIVSFDCHANCRQRRFGFRPSDEYVALAEPFVIRAMAMGGNVPCGA